MGDIHLKEEYYSTKQEKNSLSWVKKWFYGVTIFSVVVFIVLIYLFAYKQYFSTDCKIEHNIWGTFGDCFSGVIGTLLTGVSVFLLYKAYIAQINANSESYETNRQIVRNAEEMAAKEERHVYAEKLDMFERTFTYLLQSYSKELDSYFESGDFYGYKGLNLKFFNFINSKRFNISNLKYSLKAVEASHIANIFISDNSDCVNRHMRILFRILDFCANSYKTIREEDIIKYIKIFRSQLSDSEMLLIRYNCLSHSGRPMAKFVFRYNLLKHLPLLSLLEFKEYAKLLDSNEIELLNQFFINLRKRINNFFQRNTINELSIGRLEVETIIKNKYWHVLIKKDCIGKEYHFVMKKFNADEEENFKDTLSFVFNKINIKDLASLFYDFHYEVFKTSNFRQYNKGNTFSIDKTIRYSEFEIVVKHRNGLIVCPMQVLSPKFIE